MADCLAPERKSKRNSQWSILDLILLTAILGAFFAIWSFLGLGHPLFILCAVASLIISVVFVVCIPRRRFAVPAIISLLSLLLLANPLLMFFSLVMAINGVSHFVFNIVASQKERSLTTLETIYRTGLISLASFGIGVACGLPGYFELRRDRHEFAPLDLTQRLAYEKKHESPVAETVPIESTDEDWLAVEYAKLEERSARFMGREWNLKGIHERSIDAFVKSPGFGVGRMFQPTIDRAKLPPLVDVPFSGSADGHESSFRSQSYSSHLRPLDEIESGSFSSIHRWTYLDFLHPDSIGLVVRPRVAVGFAAHAFHIPPASHVSSRLRLENLELISLHRFDSPRAYVLEHMPRMDQLADAGIQTRPLDEFELSAIEKLGRSEPQSENIILDQQLDGKNQIAFELEGDSIRMVGAIRAFKSCLQCHDAHQREMLGAFSYRFVVSPEKEIEASE